MHMGHATPGGLQPDHSQLGLCQASPGDNVYLLPQRAEERHAEVIVREGSAIWQAEQAKFEAMQASLRNNVFLMQEKLRIYKEGVERLERSKDEYRGLVLHVVIAHYKEKVRKMWSRKWQGEGCLL